MNHHDGEKEITDASLCALASILSKDPSQVDTQGNDPLRPCFSGFMAMITSPTALNADGSAITRGGADHATPHMRSTHACLCGSAPPRSLGLSASKTWEEKDTHVIQDLAILRARKAKKLLRERHITPHTTIGNIKTQQVTILLECRQAVISEHQNPMKKPLKKELIYNDNIRYSNSKRDK